MVESTSILNLEEFLKEGDPNEFVCGMPRHKYFQITKKKALVIGVSDYSGLRENEGKENYLDLPETT